MRNTYVICSTKTKMVHKKKKIRGHSGFGSLIARAKPAIIETGVLSVAGWLVCCLFFCVDGIDGAQQCSVLQAISGDNDGIIHRHSCCAGFECWFFSFSSSSCGKLFRRRDRGFWKFNYAGEAGNC